MIFIWCHPSIFTFLGFSWISGLIILGKKNVWNSIWCEEKRTNSENFPSFGPQDRSFGKMRKEKEETIKYKTF